MSRLQEILDKPTSAVEARIAHEQWVERRRYIDRGRERVRWWRSKPRWEWSRLQSRLINRVYEYIGRRF